MPPLPDLDHGRCRAVDFLKPPVPPPGDDADVDSSTPMATMGTAAAGRRGVISSATAMVFVDAHSLTDGTTTTTALSLFGDGGCDGGGRTGRGTDVDDGTYGPPSALVDFRNDGIITLFLPLAAGGGDDVPPPGEDADVDLSPLMATTGTAAAAVAGTGDAISSVVAAVFFVVAHSSTDGTTTTDADVDSSRVFKNDGIVTLPLRFAAGGDDAVAVVYPPSEGR